MLTKQISQRHSYKKFAHLIIYVIYVMRIQYVFWWIAFRYVSPLQNMITEKSVYIIE